MRAVLAALAAAACARSAIRGAAAVTIVQEQDPCDRGAEHVEGVWGSCNAVGNISGGTEGHCDEDPGWFGTSLCSPGTDCDDCGSGRRRGKVSCYWKDFERKEEYEAQIYNIPLITIVVEALMIALITLPLCFFMLQRLASYIAASGILIGILCVFTPEIVATVLCGSYVDDACESCGFCTNGDRSGLSSSCRWSGMWHLYVTLTGLLFIIAGITAAGMGTCIFCGCCAMNPRHKEKEEKERARMEKEALKPRE